MNRATRELIGRATMLVVAAALLLGAVKLGQTAYWLQQEERRTAEQLRHQPSVRQTRIALCVWVACGLAGLGGVGFFVLAIASHKRLDRYVPRPATLWDNFDTRL